MKKKDVMLAALAVVILLAAGYLAYTQVLPKPTAGAGVVTVETVGPIPGAMDVAGLKKINDAKTVVNYNSPVDLSGLGNPAPFGK